VIAPPIAALHPVPLTCAVALAIFLVIRRRKLRRSWLVGGVVVTAALLAFGVGLLPIPNIEKIIEDVGQALGPWTYLLVGVLAFLETGAFVGLIAPGETTILVGGVVAGQGEINLLALIGLVWVCAVAGDLTSYVIGRRLGRRFLVEHGPRVKITEERLQQVEAFFERRGGITILIGRFIGLVRALAPFIAGASHMPLRKFVPYDVVGAGLWAALFCTLGYIFWHSLDVVTQYVGRGLFAFGTIVVLVVGVMYARRLARDREERERIKVWIEQHEDKPGVRRALMVARPLWRRLVAPFVLWIERPVRFAYGRVTPGDLGLELTTLLALAAVGGFVFVGLEDLLDDRRSLGLDRWAFRAADALHVGWLVDVLEVVTDVGRLWVVGPIVLFTAAWAVLRSRPVEAVALAIALMLTSLAVDAAKDYLDRPRPSGALVDTEGYAYPSGHAAQAVVLIACAIVLVRTGWSLAVRFAAVTVATVIVVVVGLSRVYLRAHYLSDVIGGLALGIAIFSICGIVALIVEFLRDNGRASA
jgi:membrane protein DedA with SNARE-associated domain/membrane-associated phospholipid phosphatase